MTSLGTPPPVDSTGPNVGPLKVGEAFGPRYRILRELGVGGMGAVYQAWDDELGVAVALKLIRPGATGDQAAARELELRFKRELLLARQVTHKNVVRIHDLGELSGLKYITMPYVEGADLSQILKREGKLSVERVLAITKQVASGLQAAHDVGIVHRDLKPANIMIEGETALIMDFGIARSVSGPQESAVVTGAAALPGAALASAQTRHGTLATSELTMAGGIVGTIDYMAPEQARAQAVDQRADIYALGLIAYDALLGKGRKAGFENAFEELKARMEKAPPSPRSIDPAVPEAFDRIVSTCLEPDPAHRYPTTAALVEALDRLDAQGNPLPEPRKLSWRAVAAMGVVGIGLLTGTFFVARRSLAPPIEQAPVSVLVADFENMTGEAVFDGLVEPALVLGIEGASFVNSFSRGDAQRVAEQIKPGARLDEPTAVLVALREGIGRIVTGSIAKEGSRYQLAVRLVDPAENRVIDNISGQAATRDAVLATVGDLAGRLRQGLGDTEVAGEPAGESFTAASLDAARAYASGQEHQWAGKYEEAFAAYQRAVELDPEMGRAYSGLGAVASSLGRRQEAEGYYKQALARLDRMTDRERYRTRAGYYLLTRNADQSREELQALLKQFPADSAGLSNLALAEFYRRDMARALELGLQGSALVPKNVQRKNNAALFAMYAGDFETAAREAAGVLELNPAFPKAHLAIAMSQLATGRAQDAADTYRTLERLPGSAPWLGAAGLADLALYEGRTTEAVAILEAALEREENASRRARLLVTLAEARLLQEKPAEAVAAARRSLEGTPDGGLQLLAGRVLANAGDADAARQMAQALGQRLDAESQMYGSLIEGEIALARNEPRTALEKFQAAQQAADSWLGRFGLGRAYLLGGAAAQADAEFDRCLQRRGEATSVLLDDVPTYHFFAPVHYYQGRVREELGSPGAAENYKTFLSIKQHGDEQGLVADARRRLK